MLDHIQVLFFMEMTLWWLSSYILLSVRTIPSPFISRFHKGIRVLRQKRYSGQFTCVSSLLKHDDETCWQLFACGDKHPLQCWQWRAVSAVGQLEEELVQVDKSNTQLKLTVSDLRLRLRTRDKEMQKEMQKVSTCFLYSSNILGVWYMCATFPTWIHFD